MNRLYSLLFMGGMALTANAQQINGGFDADWLSCTPWDSKGNTTTVGTRPDGWNVSNVYAVFKLQLAAEAEGKDGTGKAVKLTNDNLMKNGIPAYLTLGTPYATAEGYTAANADGGTFGGKAFAWHPDAITFDYKRDNSHGADEPATVAAYLWSGTWTQKDVPGNTAISGSAVKVDMVDRDRNILGMATATGGEVTHTDDAKLVAKLEKKIADGTDDEWQTMTIPFEYGDNATAKVDKINVIFAATDYFGDRKGIVKDNSLTVDNVRLEYWHALSSLTAYNSYGGTVNLDFSPDVFDYTVNSQYDSYKTKVLFTKTGAGSTATAAYDPATARYVITVKGEDYDEETNPDAMSVYTLQYTKPTPTLSSLAVGGHEFFEAFSSAKDFKASGVYCPDEITYTASSEYATVTPEYDEETGVLTVTVSEEGAKASSVYTITFEGKSKEPVYQIPNSDFESYKIATRFTGWNYYKNGVGPWASISGSNWPAPKRISDGYEGKALSLQSQDAYTAYVSGVVTTGFWFISTDTPTDATNYIFTDRTDVDGNLPFAGRPDAFEVYARFKAGTPKEEGAECQGSIRLVLHGEAAFTEPESEQFADSKIAEASLLIPATDVWTRYEAPFAYTGNEADRQYMLATIATSDVMGASKDDVLDVDNLRLLYYSDLADLTFRGETLEGFAPSKTAYTVKGDIDTDASALGYVARGKGAQCDMAIDRDNNTATITVNGGDIAANPDNKTVYTVVFDPTPTGIGAVATDGAGDANAYTLDGVRVGTRNANGLRIVNGKKIVRKK